MELWEAPLYVFDKRMHEFLGPTYLSAEKLRTVRHPLRISSKRTTLTELRRLVSLCTPECC